MGWRILLGALGCLAPAGCHQIPHGEPGLVISQGTSSVVGERKHAQLPAKETARVCVATAESLQKGGKYKEAIALYERAREKDPSLHDVSRHLAVLYDRMDNFEAAKREYQLALQRNPKDPDLHNDLGYGYYCRGNFAEAEKHLRQALAHDPKHARAWTNLGLTLGQQGKYVEALEAFAKVVTPAQAQCNLAFLLTAQGKLAEAKQAYREALALEPELRLARAALAKLERTAAASGADRPARAERTAARSDELQPVQGQTGTSWQEASEN
jgi:Tfp pilus assembly protein PilF